MSFTDWLMAHGDDAQFALFFGLLALLGVAERLLPGAARAAPRRSRWPANFGLTLLCVAALAMLPFSFVTAAVWAEERGAGLLHLISLPLPLLLATNLLFRGFISFGTHLAMHRLPLFWRIHRVHHLDTALDVSTTVRFHPLEFTIALPLGLPLIVMIGFTPWMLALYELLDVAVTLVSHANLRIPAPVNRWLRYVIVTPDLHRVHHSARVEETNSNFSAVFPVWDLLFGTMRREPSDGREKLVIGLGDVRDARTGNLLWLLRVPMWGQLPEDPLAQASPAQVYR